MIEPKQRFSRKALNILIFVTATLILIFSQMGQDETKGEKVAEVEAVDKVLSRSLESTESTEAENVKSDKTEVSVTHYFPELTMVPEIPEASVNVKIQHWTTEEGLSVYFAPSPELPMVDVRLVFDGGSARDPDGKEGLASLTSSLLQLAAKGVATSEVAQKFEALGAQMSASSYRDMAIANLRVLSEEAYLTPSLDLFGRVMSEIVFAEEDFAREMSRYKIAIMRKSQNPHALVGDAVFDVLYGAKHPYGTPSSGTLDSLASVTEHDIKQFHGQYYVARNGLLVIVGNVDRQRAESIADAVSLNFKPGEKASPLSRKTKKLDKVHRHIDFKSDQTHLAFVGAGVYRGHEDYYALYLANHIIGGSGFASLLNKTIRQDKAFAYSVSSRVSPMAAIGPVAIQMQTRTDQAAAAIAASRQVIDKLIDKGLEPGVLEDAKQQILSEFAMRAASNSSQLGYLGVIGFHQLPLDYLETFNQNIIKVSEEDIRYMASKYFRHMAVITLGSVDPLIE